jgi:hypothetical protein
MLKDQCPESEQRLQWQNREYILSKKAVRSSWKLMADLETGKLVAMGMEGTG